MAEILTHWKFDRAPVVNEKKRGRRSGVISLRSARLQKAHDDMDRDWKVLSAWAARVGKNPVLPLYELQQMKAEYDAVTLAASRASEMSEIAHIKDRARELLYQASALEQRVIQRYGVVAHD